MILGVSPSWFYKWRDRPLTGRQQRRRDLDAAVVEHFDASRRTHGSPRLHADLREAGWQVSEKTVAESMRRQQLVARNVRRRRGLTRQDKAAPKFPDLIGRRFTADAPNQRWVGDVTEVPTERGKLYLATVIDLFSRRLLAAATSAHPDAELCCDAIRMAVTGRGGRPMTDGVIFHSDRGSTYTANSFTRLCKEKLGIRQSMGRVGSCFDNAVAESFFSTLEWEVLSRHRFTDPDHARTVVVDWCHDFYNTRRRHSTNGMKTPAAYEHAATVVQPDAA